MIKRNTFKTLIFLVAGASFYSCVPDLSVRQASDRLPEEYQSNSDTTNSAQINWRQYFNDDHLISLIDTALRNNQELSITLQEIEIANNEVKARKGEYLPFLNVSAGGSVDKVGRYTRPGALEATTDIEPEKEFPEPFGDIQAGLYASWEIDAWKRLRNAKKSAYMDYLASLEGRNFMVTNLISEIANTYYELLALDNQLELVRQNIRIQSNALEIVKVQKLAARVTELAVRRFEAQLLDTRSLEYGIRQQIIETENRLNFLVGRYPQPVNRNSESFFSLIPDSVRAGIPSQLLDNRPDIRRAHYELEAAKLDVQVAKAQFYPSFGISAGLGYQSYNPSNLFKTPESLLYMLGADLTAPLINRKAIKSMYFNANSRQKQALIDYEQTVLRAYIEVSNQLSNITNLQSTYDLKTRQVQALNESITISNNLFLSARADYMEVLLTQREALESRFDLIETKMQQIHAWVNMYRALGGGWN